MTARAEAILASLQQGPVESSRGKGWFVADVEMTDISEGETLHIIVALHDTRFEQEGTMKRSIGLVVPNDPSVLRVVYSVQRELEGCL